MLDLAYEKDTFISGSSILSITVYESQLWRYYHRFIRRSKTDRLEYTTFRTAQGATAGKFRPALKPKDLMFSPEQQKNSSKSLFNELQRFKDNKDGK